MRGVSLGQIRPKREAGPEGHCGPATYLAFGQHGRTERAAAASPAARGGADTAVWQCHAGQGSRRAAPTCGSRKKEKHGSSWLAWRAGWKATVGDGVPAGNLQDLEPSEVEEGCGAECIMHVKGIESGLTGECE
ncbi:hypothetical protein PR202_gb03181 [Eleusine coracana subsp. coracana]|uniref:Uncharacterized protein n=1 Tax=Eleusine coracana subsp. coracana TaxID=191504 RepID=A0AAV5E0E5_ELECO|nr:hypothetical protein PR202_gb03181 [Eleusine coracana subsp. coracana]